jgi:SAM-dependent methyltransferase
MDDMYNDPQTYDLKYAGYSKDYALILEWARKMKGKILDLGCGTGRVIIPLALAGYDVEGVDLSEPMLRMAVNKAKQHGMRIKLQPMDVTKLTLGFQYSMMYMVGNTFQHVLTNHDQKLLLKGVYQFLEDDGVFIFGTRVPQLHELGQVQQYQEQYKNESMFDVVERHVEEYDPISQILSCRTEKIIRDRDGRGMGASHESLQLRYTFPQELILLLTANEFEVLQVYGSWDKEELCQDSKEMVCICKKK